MNLTLLTESGGVVETFPTSTGARIVWGLVLAGIVGIYIVMKRSRQRSNEHYWSAKQRQADLRANDPDMKRDEGQM